MLNLPAPRFPISGRSAIPQKAQKNGALSLTSSVKRPKTSGLDWFPSSVKRPSIREHGSRSPAIDQCTAVTTLSQPRTHGTRRRAPFFPPARIARPDRSSVPPDSPPRHVLSPSALRATLHTFQQWPRGEHTALFRTPRSGSAVLIVLRSQAQTAPRRSASAQKAFLLTERTKKGRPQRRPFLENTSAFRSRGRNDILFRQDP